MAPQHPKGNPRSKVITTASQLPSSSNPASVSTVAPRPFSTTVPVTVSSKEFGQLLHNFGYNYCLIKSTKDNIIETSDMKALSEIKLGDYLVSSFLVSTIFIDFFIELHALYYHTNVSIHEPWLGSFTI